MKGAPDYSMTCVLNQRSAWVAPFVRKPLANSGFRVIMVGDNGFEPLTLCV